MGMGGSDAAAAAAAQAGGMAGQMMAEMMGGGRSGGMSSDMAAMMGGPPMGMMQGMMGANAPKREQPRPVKTARRMINETIEHLMIGAVGSPEPEMPREPGGLLLAMADDPSKIQDFVDLVAGISEKLNDDGLDTELTFNEELQNQVDELRAKLGVTADAEQAEIEKADLPMEQALRQGLTGLGRPGGAPAAAAPVIPAAGPAADPAGGQSLDDLTELE